MLNASEHEQYNEPESNSQSKQNSRTNQVRYSVNCFGRKALYRIMNQKKVSSAEMPELSLQKA